MYSYEDRIRAVELYIKVGKRIGVTIRQLGYPTKSALKGWYAEYERCLDLARGYKTSRSKYSLAQREKAVEYYLEHGRCIGGARNFVFGHNMSKRCMYANQKETRATKATKIPSELLEQFGEGLMTAAAIEDASAAFKKALIVQSSAITLAISRARSAQRMKPTNQRNGKSGKTVLTGDGPIRLDIPRDREGSFSPILIPKHERRYTGFDDKIIAMYARGMAVREIRAFLSEQYSTDVSPDFISSVTDEVMAGISAWQQRPLEPMYPVIFFDALRVKIREEGLVRNKAIYLALGVLPDGTRDILGIWIETIEGAKFLMKVFNDLKTRGVEDVLIAVTGGLKRMPEALGAVFPDTTLQTCIVHLIRNSLDYAAWDKRRELAKALKPIYQALTAEAAEQALDAFENGP